MNFKFAIILLLTSQLAIGQWSGSNPENLVGRAQIITTTSGGVTGGFGLAPRLLTLKKTYTSGGISMGTPFESVSSGLRLSYSSPSLSGAITNWDWDIAANSRLHFRYPSTNLNIMTLNRDGEVGIGTSNPQSKLHIRLDNEQEVRIQSKTTNAYGGISFRHYNGTENWRIRAFSNYAGGYGNILSIVSSNNDDFWISAGKTLIGDSFNFDSCTDCNDYKLFVKKGIRTEKVRVDISSGVWADYVFKKDYNLKPLKEVEQFIKLNGHLPNIPKASVLEKEGLDLGEMDAKLLEKIEELTLYIIDLKKEIDRLKQK